MCSLSGGLPDTPFTPSYETTTGLRSQWGPGGEIVEYLFLTFSRRTTYYERSKEGPRLGW